MVGACLALVAVAAVLAVIALRDGEPDCTELAKQVRAQVDSGRGTPARGEKVQQLATCDTLVGLQRRDLRRVLGSPDEGTDGDESWSYGAGLGTDFVGDGRYLNVVFGAEGRVVEAEIGR